MPRRAPPLFVQTLDEPLKTAAAAESAAPVAEHVRVAEDGAVDTYAATVAPSDVEEALATLEAGVDAPARRIRGCLRVLCVIDHARDDLHMALGLHGSTHDAETHQRFAVLGQESRDDGMEGALAWSDHVGMTGFQTETVAAVLQADAGSRHYHA